MNKTQKFISAKRLTPQDKQYITERNKVAIEQQPKLVELESKLLEMGGEAVILRQEPDLDQLLDQGAFRSGKRAKMIKGKTTNYHENSAAYYDKNRKRVSLMCGFALLNDGLWRQHSWLAEKESRKIIETTLRRELYYGVMLAEDDADRFVVSELLPYGIKKLSQHAIYYAIRTAAVYGWFNEEAA